jgi:steroid delta-isomerase-like uncharacterized protein
MDGSPALEVPVSSTTDLVHRFFHRLWNTGETDLVEELIASDHVHHMSDGDVPGPDGVKRMVESLRTAFPDLVFRLDDVLTDADKVAVRWTASGTHAGPLGQLEASGRFAQWSGIDILRTQNGKIVELWASADALGLLEQLTVADAESTST